MSTSPTAGFNTIVNLNGPATAAVAEACSLVSGKTYQVTSSAHRILSPAAAVTVKDGGVAVVDADILSLDYLFGKVTFRSSYTPGGAITLDMSWYSVLPFLLGQEVSLGVKRAMLPADRFGNGFETHLAGLLSGQFTFKSLADANQDYDSGTMGTQSLWADFDAGTPKLVEIDPDGGALQVIRSWQLLSGLSSKYPVAGIQTLDLTGELAAQNPASKKTNVTYLTAFSFGAP